ncbi:MAG: undecaprenyl-diphosphate phosphatase [Chloroflexi bacterium]|nr:undecaprenyl-diphosphate phosphatase [Chloroflexota bacterium]
MDIVQGLVMGAVQGIAEWLPLSSEGICTLILVNFFHTDFKEAVYQAIWLHAGTLFAALVYYRKEVWDLSKHLPFYFRDIRNSFTLPPGDIINYLLIATAVSCVLGGPLLLLGIDQIQLRAVIVSALVGLLLITTGIVQKLAQRSTEYSPERTVGWKESVVTGIAQGFSVLPGISRSGVTISTLLFFRYSPAQALKLSFLLSIPAVFIAEAAILVTGKVSLVAGDIAGIISSFSVGLLAIYVVMKFAARIPFWAFCIFFGLLSLVPWLTSF